jgi:DNA-binding transcriptional ArsR family regulator
MPFEKPGELTSTRDRPVCTRAISRKNSFQRFFSKAILRCVPERRPAEAKPQTRATQPGATATGLPRRELSDPRALRAIAHPVRLNLLEELFLRGAATATELAEAVGQSPANCSWHLRQLARYGYIEEAPGGRGRERPWRLIAQSNSFGDVSAPPDVQLAAEAAARMIVDHEVAALLDYGRRRHVEPAGWRESAFVGQSMTWLTEAELAELGRGFLDLCFAHADRIADPSARPPGARPIRIVGWAIPARPPVPKGAHGVDR